MATVASAAELIPILDRFLEAAANATKWRLLTPAFRVAVKDIGAVFAQQGDLLLKRARSREARGLVPHTGLWSVREAEPSQAGWLAAWDDVAVETAPRMVEAIRAAAEVAMVIAADELSRQLSVDVAFNLRNPRATAYMREHGARWISKINDETKSRIQTILVEGIDAGDSYTQIAVKIDQMFTGFSPTSITDILLDRKKWSRSEIVAITELGNSYEAGNSIVAADLSAAGLTMQKSWITVRDGDVDTTQCGPNEAQGWIPYEDAFQSGHMQPLAHPLCRCTAGYRRKPRG